MIGTTERISTACDDRAPPFVPGLSSAGRIAHRAPVVVVAGDPDAVAASAASAAAVGSDAWYWHPGDQRLSPAGSGWAGRD
jgi:hypothetical protein